MTTTTAAATRSRTRSRTRSNSSLSSSSSPPLPSSPSPSPSKTPRKKTPKKTTTTTTTKPTPTRTRTPTQATTPKKSSSTTTSRTSSRKKNNEQKQQPINNNKKKNENNDNSSPSIKCRLVGGPLLGRRSSKNNNTTSIIDHSQSNSLPSSWRYHKPIITPEIDDVGINGGGGGGGKISTTNQRRQRQQRFILLPQQQNYITVLAYKTGTKVATLLVTGDDDDDDNAVVDGNDYDGDRGGDGTTTTTTATTTASTRIESVCLARGNSRPTRRHDDDQSSTATAAIRDALLTTTTTRMNEDDDDDEEEDEEMATTSTENDHQTTDGGESKDNDDVLVMVGCHDGTIREFSLLELVRTMSTTATTANSSSSSSSVVICGGYELPGPFIRPRRIIRVSTTATNAAEAAAATTTTSPPASIIHLTVPEIVYGSVGGIVGSGGLWMYCTMLHQSPFTTQGEGEMENDGDDDTNNKSKQKIHNRPIYADVNVCRLIIPPFDGSTNVVDLVAEQSEASHNDDSSANDDHIVQTIPARESHQMDELSNVTVMSTTKCRIDALPHMGCKITRTVPFEMVAVTRPTTTNTTVLTQHQQQQQYGLSIFVIVAKTNSLLVYHELLTTSSSSIRCRSFTPVEYKLDDKSQLTAIDVSLNKSDVTCGDRKGKIRIMNDLLVQIELHNIKLDKDRSLQNEVTGDDAIVESNNTSMDKLSVPPKVIVSKAHWHAHPVASLSYDVTSSPVDPLLYSGGDESVMVTWQTSHGRDRPADVLPRLALGGIVHLAMSSRDKSLDPRPASGVLVFCEDNSLQLIESHNKGRIWKINGLASTKTSTVHLASKSSKSTPNVRPVCIQPDPRSNNQRRSQLVMTGLKDAPGLMHWYDPTRERIISKLEVAPFNRISRTEPDEKPLPSPCVTHHAFNGNGSDLITIDEAPTENSLVGSYEQRNGSEYGIVSTIRFWVWNDVLPSTRQNRKSARAPYRQIASMTYPHGPKNRVDALALSKDGLMACTVSNEEKAFRIWEKDVLPSIVGSKRDDEEEEDGPTETWTCRYKVAVPAGLSNFSTASGGVAFSDDGSILAVGFGRHVSLWDTDEAQLLTSFLDSSGTDIENVQFVNPGLYRDLLLIQCKKGVSMRSPYGENGSTASFQSWTWSLARDAKNLSVSSIVLAESHDCVGISIYDKTDDQSQIIALESETGNPRDISGSTSYTVHRTTGRIECLTAVGRPNTKSNWDMKQQRHSPIFLYAMLSSAELILLHDLKDPAQTVSSQAMEYRTQQQSMGPRLNIRSQQPIAGQKRRLNAVGMIRNQQSERNTKRLALDVFGISASDELKNSAPTTKNLPSLSMNFVRSFVGRNCPSIN